MTRSVPPFEGWHDLERSSSEQIMIREEIALQASDFIDFAEKDFLLEIDDQIAVIIEEINADGSGSKLDFAESLKDVVVDSILGPFGLSASMFEDKDGGNITTQHNASQGLFAKESEEYDRNDYGYDAAKTRKKLAAIRDGSLDSQTFRDEYTGSHEPSMRTTEAGKLAANFELDHAIPLSEIHKEGGWQQNRAQRKDLSSTDENLYYTTHARNRDKSDKLPEEYLSCERGYDPQLIEPKIESARQAIDAKLPDSVERLKYHGTQFAIEGSVEAGKLALRQVVGLILKDLATGLIDDVKVIFRDGVQSLLQLAEILRDRAHSTLMSLRKKWQEILSEGFSAALGGLLSSFVTFVVNSFVTTLARFVTIIREGASALVRSLKLLVLPPEGMKSSDVVVEVLKLLSGAVVVVATISVQEIVAKFLEGTLLAPVAQDVATVLVAIVGGTLGLLTVLAFDKFKSSIAFQNKRLADVHRGQAVTVLTVQKTLFLLDCGYRHVQDSDSRMLSQLAEAKATFKKEAEHADGGLSDFARAVQRFRELGGAS